MSKPVIGVLALQGAVQLHKPHIEACDAAFMAVKTAAQFDDVDGFILPGGESTTMLKLIETFGLWDALENNFKTKPVWGICAGAILMAETSFRTDNLTSRCSIASSRAEPRDPQDIDGDPSTAVANAPFAQDDELKQKSFGLLPITVRRNGYGTQLESHVVDIDGYDVSFIRAPVITDAGACDVKAIHQGDPVWVQKGTYMATSFHPELTMNYPSPMHKYFVDMVRGR